MEEGSPDGTAKGYGTLAKRLSELDREERAEATKGTKVWALHTWSMVDVDGDERLDASEVWQVRFTYVTSVLVKKY